VLDAAMPPLSMAANHSLLWLVLAGAIGAFGDRRGRRAALRGVLSIGVASAITTGAVKRLLPRRRPPLQAFPFASLRRRPTSSSMPSGHAASAVAFATAAAIEFPAIGVPLGAVAGAVAYSRVYNGVHYPGDVLLGGAIGAGVAVATLKVWPRADPNPASARPASHQRARVAGEPTTDGDGLTIVINPSARSGRGTDPTDELRAALPAARIVALEEGDDLGDALREATSRGHALGIVGGDGSINAAAEVALEHDRPLVVIPGGTLNHFARDLGLETVADAISAVQNGQLVAVDVGTIDEHPFLNTASFGSYPKLVEAREKLEGSIGKWAALGVALARVLRDDEPFEVTINGRPHSIWMIFIGNCAYEPPGFAPTTRSRLDDGSFDVRIVDGSHPYARLRLIAAALTGNLARSRVYTRRLVHSIDFVVHDDNHTLAADGEVFAGHTEFRVAKHTRRLLVYAPE
jgi:diacylglycerol kinase family enzyme/membrane-associated phospholipid phosphatase